MANTVKRNKRFKLDEAINRTVISSLMSEPNGRRWMWLQLSFARIFDGTGELDHAYMAFEKGRRNTGLKLLHDILNYAPSQFIAMMDEKKLYEENLNDRPNSDPARDPESESGAS